MSIIMYLIAIAAILPTLMTASDTTLLTVFVFGVVLAYFYTANPIGYSLLQSLISLYTRLLHYSIS